MGMYLFTKAIYENRPIELYNGNIKRDFTYITDIISGIEKAINTIPKDNVPIRTYNLGNNKSELLTDFIRIIENNIGKKAIIINKNLPKTDSLRTYADITESRKDLDFNPRVSINQGIAKFVEWFKIYHNYE
jgi:UDP-glucuronate 4-epimerase